MARATSSLPVPDSPVMRTVLLVGAMFSIRDQLILMTLSIAFYGVKGGIFTINTGGQFRVYGPPGGVINENNSLAVATIITCEIFATATYSNVRKFQVSTDEKLGKPPGPP